MKNNDLSTSGATEFLQELLPKLNRNQKAHYRSCERAQRANRALGVIAILCAVAAASTYQSPIGWPFRELLMIVLPLGAAAASGVQTFSRYDLDAERHQISAVDYGALLRRVDSRISGAFSEEENRAVLDEILEEYARISKYAPLTKYSNRIAEDKARSTT